MRRRRLRDLPLFWKLLLPFLGLMLIFGAIGTLLVVRDLSNRAQAALDQDLARRSLDARTAILDRELYLLESVNFASNLQGMAGAISSRDDVAAATLLRSALALKTDLDLLVVTDPAGRGIAEFVGERGANQHRGGTDWSDAAFVQQALRSRAGERTSGFLGDGSATMLAVAAPVCSAHIGCAPAGVAIAGIRVHALVAESLRKSASVAPGSLQLNAGVTIYDVGGHALASAGLAAPAPPTGGGAAHDPRRTSRAGSTEITSLYTPLEVGDRPIATLAVTVPRAPAFALVRGAGVRLALIVLGAMAGIVGLGALLSRFILAQVRPLVDTNRALGLGDLSARAPIIADDELGELARGVNQMAEQLQASYETLELRVAQRTQEVQRLLQERTDFFASMSHEFRTPLAVILSEADMLNDPNKPVTAAFARESGKTIRHSGDQLLGVINEILELSEAAAGMIEVELEEVRLSDLMKELRPTLEGLARGNHLKISVDIARDMPPVLADRSRLPEVILNLVHNAVKYTPAGGSVSLAAAARNGSVHVSVSDTGVGIPPGVGERIFEPFYRVKGSKPLRGEASSGLGLALAKRFVEAQGGRIEFASKLGIGSTFTFTLTSVQAAHEPGRAARKVERARPAGSPDGSPTHRRRRSVS